MATGKSFGTLKDDVSSALVAVTRSAGRVSKEDLAFHRSSNPSLISMLDQQNSRLLRLAQRLTNPNFIGNEVDQPQIQNVEAIEDNWKTLVDIFDNLLEKADACLDEYTGAIRRLSPSQEEQIKKAAPQAGRQRHWGARLQQNFPKPQLLFEEGPANDTLTPFKPLLRSKPHAKVSLAESLVLLQSADGSPQYALQWSYGKKVGRELLIAISDISILTRQRLESPNILALYVPKLTPYPTCHMKVA